MLLIENFSWNIEANAMVAPYKIIIFYTFLIVRRQDTGTISMILIYFENQMDGHSPA